MNARANSACDRARALASTWVDGELADAWSLEAHLAQCSDCRAYVAELGELSRLFTPLRGEPQPIDLWPSIAARIARPRAPAAKPARRTLLLRHWSLRAAAAVVGFTGTLTVLRAVTDTAHHGARAPQVETEPWAAALHVHASDLGRLTVAPEQQLLAVLDTSSEERR